MKRTVPAHQSTLLDTKAPYYTAGVFARGRNYKYWNGGFYQWNGSIYTYVPMDDIKAELYAFLAKAKDQDGLPFKPTKSRVENIIDALKAVVNLPATFSPPCWLTEEAGQLDPSELISCANGLLHLPTMAIYPHTPAFFGQNSVSYNFNPDATCPRWLQFLEQVWGSDPDSISAFQEIVGYLISPDTRQQKIFMLWGPKRSGKGTMARLMIRLIGQENVAAPTMSSLSQQFGLAGLIAKTLAIISDARLGNRIDKTAIVERFLSISGEDAISIPRKFQSDYTARLGVRFMILTNEIPALADASGALTSRFIILKMERSFYGQEDSDLTEKLLMELPGILNWAIAGWQRLQARGYFVQPKSAMETIQEMEDLSSPISAFIRECCEVNAAAQVECSELYKKWREWCGEHGREHPGTLQTFGRDLKAALTGVRVVQHRQDGARTRFYSGVGLSNCHAVSREEIHCTQGKRENLQEYNGHVRVPASDSIEDVCDYLWKS